MSFTGWPPAALTFFEELEAHNDRDWFKEHRARYNAALVAPAIALGEGLEPDFGRVKRFRPFNDTRFHAKPPIKEQVGVAFGHDGAGGYYVELSLDGLFVAAGMHQTAPDQVARLREAVADPRRGAALREALATAQAAGLAVSEPELKRVPRGWEPDHPAADLLRHRTLTVAVRHPLRAWLHTRACGTRVRRELEATRPLVTWLRAEVGASTTPRR